MFLHPLLFFYSQDSDGALSVHLYFSCFRSLLFGVFGVHFFCPSTKLLSDGLQILTKLFKKIDMTEVMVCIKVSNKVHESAESQMCKT